MDPNREVKLDRKEGFEHSSSFMHNLVNFQATNPILAPLERGGLKLHTCQVTQVPRRTCSTEQERLRPKKFYEICHRTFKADRGKKQFDGKFSGQ
jgi:hypothetical protein